MQKKTKVIASAVFLVAILGAFILVNKGTLSASDESQGGHFRFPASTIFGEMRSASIAVERRIAAELAPNAKKRRLASLGHPASDLENLRFGVLEGKYAVVMEGDHIRDLSFIDTPDSTGSPKDIGNRAMFLKHYAALFGLKGIPEKVSVDISGNHVVEVYQVKSPISGTKTIIQVVLDDSDRLLDLHAQRTSDLKFF